MTSALFRPQYHDWGETFKQDTKPPTDPWASQQNMSAHSSVCVGGGGGGGGGGIILGHASCHFNFHK